MLYSLFKTSLDKFILQQYKSILSIKICTLLAQNQTKTTSMKKKYQIISTVQPLRLNFTIMRNIQGQNKYQARTLHATLNLLNLHPDVLKIFGTFNKFCRYVQQHPENLQYDQQEFSLMIRFKIVDMKCIYLTIAELEDQKIRKNQESLLILQQALQTLKEHVFVQHSGQSFEQKIKQIQWYSQNMKKAKSQCAKYQIQLQNIEQQIVKLSKKSIGLEYKMGQQYKNIKWSKQEKIKRRRQLFLEQFNNCEDSKVKKLKLKPSDDINVLDLEGLNLKSMIVVDLYKNLKEIKLSNNLINRIEGLQKLPQLTHLDLSRNEIQVIQGLEANTVLKQLILHTNSISKFKNLFHLKNLRILSLSFNKLVQIPPLIIQLQSLIELRLENNQINSLPEDLLNLKELKVITLLGNPCFTSSHRMQSLIDILVDKKNIITISSEY